MESAEKRGYILNYWRGWFAYLLTQTYPRSRVEREEHERIGSQECFSLIDEALRVEFFRC